MLRPVRSQCLICGGHQLQPFLNLAAEGVAHSALEHTFTYVYRILHRSLRGSSERLWGGVKHAINPEGKVSFVWLSLAEQPNHLAFQVDPQRRIGQAA